MAEAGRVRALTSGPCSTAMIRNEGSARLNLPAMTLPAAPSPKSRRSHSSDMVEASARYGPWTSESSDSAYETQFGGRSWEASIEERSPRSLANRPAKLRIAVTAVAGTRHEARGRVAAPAYATRRASGAAQLAQARRPSRCGNDAFSHPPWSGCVAARARTRWHTSEPAPQ